MLFGALDYWSLFHIGYGVYMAHAARSFLATYGIAVGWEVLETTDWEPLRGSTFGALVNPSGLNAVADVAVALIAWWLTRRVERALARQRAAVPVDLESIPIQR